jgi:Tfp pilus assembly protein PilF
MSPERRERDLTTMIRSTIRRAAPWALLALLGCPNRPPEIPTPDQPSYAAAITAFFKGTLALQVNDKSTVGAEKVSRAFQELKKATELAPGEPAAWANLGLVQLNENKLDEAATSIGKARTMAPNSLPIQQIEAALLQKQGKYDQALALLRKAADSGDIRAAYAAAQVAAQGGAADAEAVQAGLYDQILKASPKNAVALAERARLAAKAGDAAALNAALATMQALSPQWPAEARTALGAARTAAAASPRQATVAASQLKNVLLPLPDFQAGRQALGALADNQAAQPVLQLIALKSPPDTAAEPDSGLTYTVAPAGGGAAASASVAFPIDTASVPLVAALDRAGNRIARVDKPGALPAPAAPAAIAPFDLDSVVIVGENGATPSPEGHTVVYRLDLAIVGAGGLRIARQKDDGTFVDATTAAKLPAAITSAAYTGVWAVDIDADGDLDLVLSPARGDAPIVLQNRGDGTFAPIPSPFRNVACPLRAFAWADADNDGDPDIAFVDAKGALIRFDNERSGRFSRAIPPSGIGPLAALAVLEANGGTALDFVGLQADGQIVAITDKVTVLAKATVEKPTTLLVADLDNNGAVDLVAGGASTSQAFLSTGPGTFAAKPLQIALAATAVADTDNDGVLDLIGAAGGKASIARGDSPKKYASQRFTLRAAFESKHDGKINSFCAGGEVETRSGLLYQKLPITGPQVHIGLGTYKAVDAARVVWTNGNAQGEFDLKAGPVIADQRLGGSCPFLFAWDGTKMRFVTDCIWRSPLGLKINAQDTAGVSQTTDWVKIRGDQLVARDGFYDLAVTAELRETHFFDHLSLMTVDHPEGTEIFVDERFSPVEKPLLAVIPTGPTHPVTQARGTNGQDVSDLVRARDQRYVDDFGRGRYQGVTQDHWIEVELGSEVPTGKPLYLIAFGWLHPTDSSINVALGQNPSAAPPSSLSLETIDAAGKWTVAKPGLGFPEGKVKTIVLRIDDAFRPGAPRRLRLRTNLEIFWDQLSWAEALPGTKLASTKLAATTAQLRYRGFSEVRAADASSPELPQDYDRRITTAPRWRDLEGCYTRFGDVKPLLSKIDDRYVIMNAGDEMQLRFSAPPPPPAGMKRDFVLIGDGWVKDGNVNTAFGKTVLPLPAHDLVRYETAPKRLVDDPVYKRHAADWAQYHTRTIGTTGFQNAMLPPPAERRAGR